MAPQWDKALVKIASAKTPEALPGDDRMLLYDDRTITIYDKFAKAQFHFLVLPRIPFRASLPKAIDKGTPTLSAANGKLNFGATSSNSVPASHMKSISTLLASPYAAEVLQALREASDHVVETIRKDMLEQYGTTWEIERAFHAVPSMEHLHLHVVSMDLVSDRLKHKKHFRSFHPTVGFALRLDDVEALVKQGKKALPKSETAYEQLLKGPLVSHHTGQTFRYFPELKGHLESYWRNIIQATSEQTQQTSSGVGLKRGAVDQKAVGTDTSSSPSSNEPPSQMRKLDTSEVAVEDQSDSEDDEPSLPAKK